MHTKDEYQRRKKKREYQKMDIFDRCKQRAMDGFQPILDRADKDFFDACTRGFEKIVAAKRRMGISGLRRTRKGKR